MFLSNLIVYIWLIYMAQMYAAPPAGGLLNIPEALFQGLLYRYKKYLT
jgi:hypothetical protein